VNLLALDSNFQVAGVSATLAHRGITNAGEILKRSFTVGRPAYAPPGAYEFELR